MDPGISFLRGESKWGFKSGAFPGGNLWPGALGFPRGPGGSKNQRRAKPGEHPDRGETWGSNSRVSRSFHRGRGRGANRGAAVFRDPFGRKLKRGRRAKNQAGFEKRGAGNWFEKRRGGNPFTTGGGSRGENLLGILLRVPRGGFSSLFQRGQRKSALQGSRIWKVLKGPGAILNFGTRIRPGVIPGLGPAGDTKIWGGKQGGALLRRARGGYPPRGRGVLKGPFFGVSPGCAPKFPRGVAG